MIDETAVSVLPNDGGIDEFPVLKAFQQYIDAEQNKARKRLMLITAIFSIFMLVVVAVFVILLINVTQRNQTLNDRLVDYAMQQNNRPNNSPVVVQSAADNSALLQLTAKLEEMRKNFETEKRNRETTEAEKAKRAETESPQPTAQDLEILRLKNLLQIEKDRVSAEKEKVAAEKAKVAAEKARQKEIELDAYRRRHYPELYAPKDADKESTSVAQSGVNKPKPTTAISKKSRTKSNNLDEIDAILQDIDDDDAQPISYFDDDEEESEESDYKIPVKSIKPSAPTTSSRWRIPTDL